jgi:hypothetical protein
MNKLYYFLFILLLPFAVRAQTAYNPFTQNIHFIPEPTVQGYACGSTQQVEFIAGLLTADNAPLVPGDPLKIVVCIAGFEFDSASMPIITGSYAANFNWSLQPGNPSCVEGVQNQTLPGTGFDPLNLNPNATGNIKINLQTPLLSPVSTVLSVNVSLVIPSYMTSTNSTGDDPESTQTQTFCDCYPLSFPGTIADNQQFCGPATPSVLNSTASPTGGSGGNIIYQWQTWDGTNWIDLPGASNATFAPPTLSNTTLYRRNAKRDLCGSWISSNVVTMTVNPAPIADAGPDQAMDCLTQSVIIGSTDIPGNSYSWMPTLGVLAPFASLSAASPTATTNYTVTVTNMEGCTAADVVMVEVVPPTSQTINASACDSYYWNINGQTYTSSGTYVEVIGCYTETLQLTITNSTTNTTTANACDTYTWSVNGVTYTQSGSYTETNGCHTEILNLSITPSITNTYPVSTCTSYTWPVNNQTYTTSGTYTEVSGCITNVLDLTIKTAPAVTATDVFSCPGYPVVLTGSPAGGSWSLPNPYNGLPTTYTYYYTDPSGCAGSATASVGVPIIQFSHVDNITGISAFVHYYGVAGMAWYELRWRPVGSTVWTVGTNSDYLTKIIPGLIENTTYEVQVRGFCSPTSVTPWSSTLTFTTNDICGIPLNPSSFNISCNGATLTWTNAPGGYNYTVRWRKVGTTTWITGSTKGNTKVISNLISNSQYEFQVRTDCIGSSGWSTVHTFNTCTNRAVQSATPDLIAGVRISPNPMKDELRLEAMLEATDEVTIQLYDVTGRVVAVQQLNQQAGYVTTTVSVSSLPLGTYTCRITRNGQPWLQEVLVKSVE